MTIVVTGANGFVGSHLCRALQRKGMAYRAVVREGAQASPGTAGLVRLPSLDAHTDWTTALQGATRMASASRLKLMCGMPLASRASKPDASRDV